MQHIFAQLNNYSATREVEFGWVVHAKSSGQCIPSLWFTFRWPPSFPSIFKDDVSSACHYCCRLPGLRLSSPLTSVTVGASHPAHLLQFSPLSTTFSECWHPVSVICLKCDVSHAFSSNCLGKQTLQKSAPVLTAIIPTFNWRICGLTVLATTCISTLSLRNLLYKCSVSVRCITFNCVCLYFCVQFLSTNNYFHTIIT